MIRLFEFVKPYRWLVAGSLLALVIFTNLGLLLPWTIKIIIDDILPSRNMNMLVFMASNIGGLIVGWLVGWTITGGRSADNQPS